MSREITVQVPPGFLGICFEDSLSNDYYRTKISAVSSDSPLAETLFHGDMIASVNGVDVHKINASGMTEIFQQSSQVKRVITLVRPSVVTFEMIGGDRPYAPPPSDTFFDKSVLKTSSSKMTSSICDDRSVNSSGDPLARDCKLQITTNALNSVMPRPTGAIRETGQNETTELYRNVCDASIVDVTSQVIANAVLVNDEEVFVAEIVPGSSQDTTALQRQRPISGKRNYVTILVVLIISLCIMVVVLPLTTKALRNASADNSQSTQMATVDGDSSIVSSSNVPSLRPSVRSETVKGESGKSCNDPPCDNPEKSHTTTEEATDDKTATPTTTGPAVTEPVSTEPVITKPATTEPTPSPVTPQLSEQTETPQPNAASTKATPEPTPKPNLEPSSEPTTSPINEPLTLSPSGLATLLTQNINSRSMEWLDAHNTRRKTYHEQYGETYIPLVWSDSLAEDAQSWADKINDGSGCMATTQNNIYYGQSASAWWSPTIYELDATDDVLVDWVDDAEGLDYPDNQKFTQALWRASKYVGCGESIQEFSKSGTTAMCRSYVCYYVRKGNCNMGSYINWTVPMLMDDTVCGDECPSEGCFWEEFNTQK